MRWWPAPVSAGRHAREGGWLRPRPRCAVPHAGVMVGEVGLEPTISCSQSTCVADYATPRRSEREYRMIPGGDGARSPTPGASGPSISPNPAFTAHIACAPHIARASVRAGKATPSRLDPDQPARGGEGLADPATPLTYDHEGSTCGEDRWRRSMGSEGSGRSRSLRRRPVLRAGAPPMPRRSNSGVGEQSSRPPRSNPSRRGTGWFGTFRVRSEGGGSHDVEIHSLTDRLNLCDRVLILRRGAIVGEPDRRRGDEITEGRLSPPDARPSGNRRAPRQDLHARARRGG